MGKPYKFVMHTRPAFYYAGRVKFEFQFLVCRSEITNYFELQPKNTPIYPLRETGNIGIGSEQLVKTKMRILRKAFKKGVRGSKWGKKIFSMRNI